MRISWKKIIEEYEKTTVEHWEDYKYTKERPIGDKALVIDDHLKAAKDLWNQLIIHWKIIEENLETSIEHCGKTTITIIRHKDLLEIVVCCRWWYGRPLCINWWIIGRSMLNIKSSTLNISLLLLVFFMYICSLPNALIMSSYHSSMIF